MSNSTFSTCHAVCVWLL